MKYHRRISPSMPDPEEVLIMSVRSKPIVEAKKQKCPHVEKIRIDGDSSQAWSTNGGQKQSMG